MLKTIEGIYRKGKADLLESPEEPDDSHVIVTFLPANGTGRNVSAMTGEEIADLRWRLTTFEDDWNAPGMEVYDDL